MNIAEQLDAVSGTNRLVLVEFYADWSPHYEWLEPVVRTYEKQVSEVIKVNIVRTRQWQIRSISRQPRLLSLAARARIVETSGRTDHR